MPRHLTAIDTCGPSSWCIVLSLVMCGRLSADERWVDERIAGPFHCRSEFSLESELKELEELAQLYMDVRATLSLGEGKGKIQLNLFRSRRSYVNYVSQRIPGGVTRRALYVKGQGIGRMYVYRHFGYETDLRHEATHAILHDILPYLPLWLDEGLAEYFEVTQGKRSGGHPHLGSLKRSIFFGWKPNLSILESKQSMEELDGKDYREAWAWVHFMLHSSPEALAVLTDYLDDIQSKVPPGSLRIRLHQQFEDPQAELIQHIKSWRD